MLTVITITIILFPPFLTQQSEIQFNKQENKNIYINQGLVRTTKALKLEGIEFRDLGAYKAVENMMKQN